MHGERRDHGVERTRERQLVIEVVLHQMDARVTGEPSTRGVDHRWRHVDEGCDRVGVCIEHERGEAPVARTEVEDTTRDRARQVAHE
jgi:hypothetical protein